MAIFTPGGLVASISGSVAGTTFSRNRGGAYARLRAIPTNPNSPQQQAVRALVAQLTSLWRDTLTVAQRTAWDEYAEAVPLPNPLGQDRNVGGLGMYVRSNVPRLQADATNLPRVDDAPTTFNLGDYTAPTFGTVNQSDSDCDVSFTAGDDWVGEDDAGLLIYGGRGKNPSINYFKGPYRFAGAVLGDGATPPTSPEAVTMPFSYATAQRCFVRAQVTRADGRLSSDFRTFAVVGAG